MIIFRYLAQEVLATLAALTIILLLVFLSNEFVHYMQFAANGGMAGVFVLRLMMLEIPTLLGLLLPLGLFMGILIAYGRLYADSEMTVLMACGMSQRRLVCYTMFLSSCVALLIAVLVLWLGPHIMGDRNRILSLGRSAMVEMILPKRFQSTPHGKQVIYVEDIPRSRHKAENIFFANQSKASKKDGQKHWDLITAEEAYVRHDDANDEDYVVLENGQQYVGRPGELDYKVVRFAKFFLRIPQPKPLINKKERAMPTIDLLPLNNPDSKLAAELQWRLSIPLMALALGFLAVPLSRISPRQGKYAKILPSVIVFIIYANMMFVARRWIAEGALSPVIGLWWLHGLVVLLGVVLLFMPEFLQRLRYRGTAA